MGPGGGMIKKCPGDYFPHDNKCQDPGKPHQDFPAYFTYSINCFNERTHYPPLFDLKDASASAHKSPVLRLAILGGEFCFYSIS